jgi:hypothetical protein
MVACEKGQGQIKHLVYECRTEHGKSQIADDIDIVQKRE